jgi:hypothetical protein
MCRRRNLASSAAVKDDNARLLLLFFLVGRARSRRAELPTEHCSATTRKTKILRPAKRGEGKEDQNKTRRISTKELSHFGFPSSLFLAPFTSG